MNENDSLNSRYPSKVEAIRNYLHDALDVKKKRESEDFDRDGIIIRIEIPSKNLRLFISHEFLSDFTPAQIHASLRGWRVGEHLRDLAQGNTLFVTTEGIFSERTEGPSLRETAEAFSPYFEATETLNQLYERVFSILVNDVPLGNIPSEMRGDPDLYSAYSENFAKIVGSVYLLDAAGYRNFAIFDSESMGVDFRIRFTDGSDAFFELKRAINPNDRKASSTREDMNAELRRLIRDNEQLRNSLKGLHVQLNFAMSPQNLNQLQTSVNEIKDFVFSEELRTAPMGSFRGFNDQTFPVLSSLGAKVYVAPGVTHISVQEGARSFDPYEPFREVARIVKNESVKKFDVSPVWLGISLADLVWMLPPDDVLDPRRIPNFDVNKTPFDQIIIGSANSARQYFKK